MLDFGDQGMQLLPVIALGIVQVDHLGTFLQRHPDPLATQYQFYPNPISRGVQPLLALPSRFYEAFFLIKPDGARSDAKFLSEFGNGEQSLVLVALLLPGLHQ